MGMHIDEWMDRPTIPSSEGISYAKWMFFYFRLPAWAQMEFYPFMKDRKLFCLYDGKKYRVTGASRMGDVWLTSNHEQEDGYEKRVDVTQCSNWTKE